LFKVQHHGLHNFVPLHWLVIFAAQYSPHMLPHAQLHQVSPSLVLDMLPDVIQVYPHPQLPQLLPQLGLLVMLAQPGTLGLPLHHHAQLLVNAQELVLQQTLLAFHGQ